MDMHHVRYFLAVAREANFTRAARVCNVSQPSLSRAIAQLETEFGGRLFLREPSNVRLTDLGLTIEPHLAATMNSAHFAKCLAREFRSASLTRLRIGVMRTIAPGIFTSLLSKMGRDYPHVVLAILDGTLDDIRKGLMDGSLDAAIYATRNDTDVKRVHAISLFREQMVVILRHGHRLSRKPKIEIHDLDGESYVARAHCEFNNAVDAIFETRGVARRVVCRSERDDWVQTMVASGVGFGIMPRTCVTHAGLTALPLVDPDLWREVNFVTIRGRQRSAGLCALLREIAAMQWPGVQTAIAS